MQSDRAGNEVGSFSNLIALVQNAVYFLQDLPPEPY